MQSQPHEKVSRHCTPHVALHSEHPLLRKPALEHATVSRFKQGSEVREVYAVSCSGLAYHLLDVSRPECIENDAYLTKIRLEGSIFHSCIERCLEGIDLVRSQAWWL